MSEKDQVTTGQRAALRDGVRMMAAEWLVELFSHNDICPARRYIVAVMELADVSALELADWATWGDGSYEL